MELAAYLYIVYFLQICVCAAREYCLSDVVQQSCSNDKLILTSVSEYGRMKVGLCIPENYKIGCSVSEGITEYVDSFCAGVDTCSLDVSELVKSFDPCPGLLTYLEAGFHCHTGKLYSGNDSVSSFIHSIYNSILM